MSEFDSILPGTVIGGCKVIECIGTGGMGQVYKAQHQRLGRLIALKILPEDVIRRHPAGIERFFQEARTLATIEHPNVLTIHDCGQDGAFHYLQTRFIEGKNLEELVLDHPQGVPGDRVCEVLIGALTGLGAVHRAGMVHRDIKPANFMIDAGQRVILMDFGLAKFLSASNDARTEPGYVLGTPQYMSPEQCDGLELDPRSDIYSLGCVGYFLLTAVRPFESDNPLAIMKMHRDTYATPLMQMRPGTGSPLCRIVEKMMQKNPDDRYADVEACVRELRALASEGPAPASTRQLSPAAGTANSEPFAGSVPNAPPTSAQPAGMPVTAGPMPAYPPTSVQPRAPAGMVSYDRAPGPATITAAALEAQSMETLYRSPPPSQYDPMGPTLSGGPSPLGSSVRQLTPPAGLPSQTRVLTAPAPHVQAPLTPATPAAPLPPPAAPVESPAPTTSDSPGEVATVPAPTTAANAATAAGRAGPSTMEVSAGVQKLRKATARIERPATAPAAPAPAAAPAPVTSDPAPAVGADMALDPTARNSQLLQAIQCKNCRHLWRIDRARLGKTVRCPNCNKDTLAQLPDNLIKPVNKARLALKIIIVVVLFGAFAGVLGYVYKVFEPADTAKTTIAAKLKDIQEQFREGNFAGLYDSRFAPELKKSLTREEWLARWRLKMNDREITECVLEYGDQYTSPIDASLSLTVRRVIGEHTQDRYKLRLKLVEDHRVWKIAELRME